MSKPGKVLKGLCKKLGVRLTIKRGKKRVYKSVAVLKRQCANKKKKRKAVKKKKKVRRKRRRKFGTNPLFTFAGYKPSPEQRERERRRKLEQEASEGLLNLNKPKGHSPWKYQPREGDVEITFNSNLGITIDWDNKHNIYVEGYENNVKPEIKNKIKKGMFITNINDKKAPVQRVDGRGSFIRMLKREKSKGPVKITFSYFPCKIEDLTFQQFEQIRERIKQENKVESDEESVSVEDDIIDLYSNETMFSDDSDDFDFSIPDTILEPFQTISRPLSRKQRLEKQRKDWYNRVCSYCLMPRERCICKQFGRKRKKVKRKRKKVKKKTKKKVKKKRKRRK